MTHRYDDYNDYRYQVTEGLQEGIASTQAQRGEAGVRAADQVGQIAQSRINTNLRQSRDMRSREQGQQAARGGSRRMTTAYDSQAERLQQGAASRKAAVLTAAAGTIANIHKGKAAAQGAAAGYKGSAIQGQSRITDLLYKTKLTEKEETAYDRAMSSGWVKEIGGVLDVVLGIYTGGISQGFQGGEAGKKIQRESREVGMQIKGGHAGKGTNSAKSGLPAFDTADSAARYGRAQMPIQMGQELYGRGATGAARKRGRQTGRSGFEQSQFEAQEANERRWKQSEFLQTLYGGY